MSAKAAGLLHGKPRPVPACKSWRLARLSSLRLFNGGLAVYRQSRGYCRGRGGTATTVFTPANGGQTVNRTGTITVGPLGLASALIGLDLIAKNLLIQGPLSNGFSSSTASVRAIAGTSHVALNTALSPTDNANDWLTLTPPAMPDTAALGTCL